MVCDFVFDKWRTLRVSRGLASWTGITSGSGLMTSADEWPPASSITTPAATLSESANSTGSTADPTGLMNMAR